MASGHDQNHGTMAGDDGAGCRCIKQRGELIIVPYLAGDDLIIRVEQRRHEQKEYAHTYSTNAAVPWLHHDDRSDEACDDPRPAPDSDFFLQQGY